jgi:NF-kappa-B inhibitor-interacting Ras-like protein
MLKPSAGVNKYHRVFVIGLKNCGKTSLLDQLIYANQPQIANSRTSNEGWPIEDIYSAIIENEERGCKERIHFFETPSIPSIQLFNPDSLKHYVNYADGFVLVYAIDKKESFSIMELVKRTIDKSKEKRDIPILVLGNKLDNFRYRQVDRSEAEIWSAKEKVRLVEVTATDRQTLIEPFVFLTSRLSPSVSKSSFSKHAAKRSTSIAADL